MAKVETEKCDHKFDKYLKCPVCIILFSIGNKYKYLYVEYDQSYMFECPLFHKFMLKVGQINTFTGCPICKIENKYKFISVDKCNVSIEDDYYGLKLLFGERGSCDNTSAYSTHANNTCDDIAYNDQILVGKPRTDYTFNSNTHTDNTSAYNTRDSNIHAGKPRTDNIYWNNHSWLRSTCVQCKNRVFLSLDASNKKINEESISKCPNHYPSGYRYVLPALMKIYESATKLKCERDLKFGPYHPTAYNSQADFAVLHEISMTGQKIDKDKYISECIKRLGKKRLLIIHRNIINTEKIEELIRNALINK